MPRYRIMVVDDDPDIRFVVMSLLSLDFEATQASNGLDALEKIERYEPDMLLMDVNMPVMNGIACCQAIKSSSQFEHLPVIFLSASSDPSTKENALAAGAVAFFGKPFNTTELIEAIHSHFATKQIEPMEKLFSLVEIEQIDDAPLALDAPTGWAFLPEPSTSTSDSAPETLARTEREAGSVSDGESGRKRRVFGRQRPKSADEVPITAPVEKPHAPPAEEPVERAPVELPLPPPPAPDYSRISRQYVERIRDKELRESQQVRLPEPPPPVRPSRERVPVEQPPVIKPAAHHQAPPRAKPEIDENLRSTPPGIPRFSPPASPAPPAPPAVPPSVPAVSAVPAFVPPPPIPRAPVAPAPPTGPKTGVSAPAEKKEKSPAEIIAERRLAVLAKAGLKVAGAGERPAGVVKPRVLVLCDQPDQIAVSNEALKGIAEFLPLEDPVEAVALIARFQPDVVILSIVERKYSGLEMAQMIQSNRRLAHIEIIFVQNAFCQQAHVNRATQVSRNQILRIPLTAERIRNAVSEVFRKPGFQPREKALGYGVYVTEVIRAAEAERAKQRKYLEKQSFEDQYQSLASFMAKELKDYREPTGLDELKGIGAKSYRVGDP